MPDYAALRATMVEGQVRANDVTDARVQMALRAVPRERFVPAAKRTVAYMDGSIEVARGRFLIDPRSFAKMIQLAEIGPDDVVLDVGCATGYSSAVLARLATTVVALEQDADLARAAGETLIAVGVDNVAVVQGPLAAGLPAQAPFDVIFLNGAVEAPPHALLSQLKEGGRLVAAVREGAASRAHLYLARGGTVGDRVAFDAQLPVLPGFQKSAGFVF